MSIIYKEMPWNDNLLGKLRECEKRPDGFGPKLTIDELKMRMTGIDIDV